jgi:conjugal transfer ATP-binding protein TraC
MSVMASLSTELPYWEFFDNPIPHAVLFDGSVSSAVELLPLDIECFDEARINQLTFGLRSFVNTLPEGVTAQVCVRVESDFSKLLESHDTLRKETGSFLSLVDKTRIENLRSLSESGEVFRSRIYLSLRTNAAEKPSFFALGAAKKFTSEFSKSYAERVQLLSHSLDGAKSLLTSLGFSFEPLSQDSLIQFIYSHLNPKRSKETEQPVIHKSAAVDGDSPRNQMVFGDLVLDQDDFILDRMRTRVLTLKTLPEVTYAGMMSGFLNLPFKYDLFFSFNVPDQAKEMRSLEQKRRMAHSLAHSTGGRVSDLESESKLSQTTDLIREIIESGQKIFQAELVLVLREDSSYEGQKRLNLRTKEVLARFKTLSGSEGLQETVGSWKVFKSELPLAPLKLVRAKKLKTHNLVDFLPLYGSARGDEKPVTIAETRLGSLYSIDPYSSRLSNFNQLCTGSSGSGKSFANNFLTLQQIARGVRCYVIDVGGSYKKLTHLLGGQYFEINLSENYAINPFDLSDPSQAPSGERLKSLVSVIEQMIVDQGDRLSRLDRVQIEETLSICFDDARGNIPPQSPTLSDFARLCNRSVDENLIRIGKLLFPWIGNSPFGKLLDRQGRIGADSPVVAFDLKGLAQYPDLQAVMILILTNFILDQIETDKLVPKRVLLDEAWELLKSPAAASFMEYAARTFRKTGSGITFITQGVEEIISSGIGPAILNNTATKLIMLQKGDTKILQDTLKLNSQELRLIQGLEQRKGVFSEGFLISGEERQVIRFRPSPVEYWISTSDSRDNHFLSSLEERGLSLEEAVIEAAKLAPFGVAAMKVVHREM